MANLKTEYVDIKDVRHKVEHIIPASVDKSSKEQITEALCNVLSKSKKISA